METAELIIAQSINLRKRNLKTVTGLLTPVREPGTQQLAGLALNRYQTHYETDPLDERFANGLAIRTTASIAVKTVAIVYHIHNLKSGSDYKVGQWVWID